MSDLVRQPPVPPSAIVPARDRVIPEESRAAVADAISSAWAKNTQRAYRVGWERFERWCTSKGRQALPAAPETIVLFLTEAGPGIPLPSLAQAVAAIGHRHALAGFDPPPTRAKAVQVVWKGVRRNKARRKPRGKAPVTLVEMRQILACLDRTDLSCKRDAAILLVGFWSAQRREQIAAIEVEHLSKADQGGLALYIPRSKTDQEGEGTTIGLARTGDDVCPVAALADWLSTSGITAGPVFRGFRTNPWTGKVQVRATALNPQQVGRIVKAWAGAAGLDGALFGGHSLRRGHVTEALRQGVAEAAIMEQTGHKNVATLRRYNAEANPVARGSAGRMKTR